MASNHPPRLAALSVPRLPASAVGHPNVRRPVFKSAGVFVSRPPAGGSEDSPQTLPRRLRPYERRCQNEEEMTHQKPFSLSVYHTFPILTSLVSNVITNQPRGSVIFSWPRSRKPSPCFPTGLNSVRIAFYGWEFFRTPFSDPRPPSPHPNRQQQPRSHAAPRPALDRQHPTPSRGPAQPRAVRRARTTAAIQPNCDSKGKLYYTLSANCLENGSCNSY